MVKQIPLTQGRAATVDDRDYDRLAQMGKWFAQKHKTNTYAVRATPTNDTGKRTLLYMHRVILGVNDPQIQVDHIDGDGTNNRRNNLRQATRAANQHNRPLMVTNQSGYVGVCWSANDARWKAYINTDGKRRHLGLFDTPEAAAEARDDATRLTRGEFGRYNFPQPNERGLA